MHLQDRKLSQKGGLAMSTIEADIRDTDSYRIISWSKNQESIFYQVWGDYQGEWLLVSRDDKSYFFYHDYYGSCSGCDAYEAEFGFGGFTSMINSEDGTKLAEYRLQAVKFAKDYPSFVEVPNNIMISYARLKTLSSVLPKNMGGSTHFDDMLNSVKDIELIAKVHLGTEEDISTADILGCGNEEVRHWALEKFTYERFIKETNASIIQKDSRGQQLLQIKTPSEERDTDIMLVKVKDHSTSREYLLRVPPTMKSVKEAVAWTFELSEREYNPIIET